MSDAAARLAALRAAVVEALLTAPAAFIRDDPEAAARYAARHDEHASHGGCALCRGEAETLTDAVLPVAERLAAEAERLAAELDGRDEEARERWIQKQLAETALKSVDFRNGMAMEIEAAREMVAAWVGAARAMLGDAENYSETPIEMEVKVGESPERFVFVLQRAGKLTPHQARQRAEAEVSRLAAELDQAAEVRRQQFEEFRETASYVAAQRDRYRAAWRSARRGRRQARATALREAAIALTNRVVVSPGMPEDERARNRSRLDVADELDRMAASPAECLLPHRTVAEEDARDPVTVVTARWGGEGPWIDEDGTVSVPLTVEGRPVVLALDGDAPKLLADELADCHRVNSHSCDNCEGVDPDTCLFRHDTPEEN